MVESLQTLAAFNNCVTLLDDDGVEAQRKTVFDLAVEPPAAIIDAMLKGCPARTCLLHRGAGRGRFALLR